ncbi:MAG: hypothetical protein WKG00_25400 [Polyangiaceae bacterium]
MQLVTRLTCPGCGAPLRVAEGQRHAMCPYCSASVLVGAPPPAMAGSAAAAPTAVRDGVSPADVEQIKALVVAGKRDQAVGLYQRVAGVDRPDAEQAVDQLSILSLVRMTRRAPLQVWGIALYCAVIAVGVGLAAWAGPRVIDQPAYALLVLLGAAIAARHVWGLVPKLVSTVVTWVGATGRGHVLRSAVLSARFAGDGVLKLVLFEVQPDAGGAPFVDEEVIALHPRSAPLLEPGNVVPVRFDGRRTRVFPISPIRVVARAGLGYRG